MQLNNLYKEIDVLQRMYGAKNLNAIYGAGCVKHPKAMLVFMNPTGKNISAQKTWNGIRAPWLGTKNIWKLLYQTNLFPQKLFYETQARRAEEWDEYFAQRVYTAIADKKIYITNLAKCTQIDARPLSDAIFKKYVHILHKEINTLSPKHIFVFGNQVASVVLNNPTRVSEYEKKEEKILVQNHVFAVHPTHYPVGQGMRNMPRAVKKIKKILS